MEYIAPSFTWIQMLFVLIFAHCLADYPLQGDFLATAKNPDTPLGKLFWKHALTSHAMIHAGFVFLITGSVILGIAEFVIHFITDLLKCKQKISLFVDQLIHYGCKVLWVVIVFSGIL